MTRVLVIGSGMAGSAAALAAKAAGAEVTVVAAGPGATAFSSGPVWSHVVGPVTRFDGFSAVPADSRLANVLGELRVADQAMEAQARGAIAQGVKVGLVGLSDAPQLFDAEWATDALCTAGIDAEALELSIYLTAEECRRSPYEWATAVDSPAEQQRWAEGLKRVGQGRDLLLLPPILGWKAEAFDRIRSLSGLAIGELSATTPSVPGLRLNRLLEARVRAAGCRMQRSEVRTLTPDRAILSNGHAGDFDRAVLATGRFVGGGVRRKPSFAEPLLGLSLAIDDEPAPLPGAAIESLSGETPGADAAAFRLGLKVDVAQHPFDSRGEVVAWLSAAGNVIAGPDRGLGFAWASGTAAGHSAAGRAIAEVTQRGSAVA